MEGSGPEGQAGDLGAPLTSLKPWPAQQEARQRKGQAPVPGEDSGVRDRGPAAVGRSGSAHRPRFKPELCTEGDQARGDRIPEVSRPTPGEAEGAGATRGPASDPSTRQRQLQPRAPTGPRGRWVTATQVPTVRPAPTRRPPRWTGCSLSAPAGAPPGVCAEVRDPGGPPSILQCHRRPVTGSVPITLPPGSAAAGRWPVASPAWGAPGPGHAAGRRARLHLRPQPPPRPRLRLRC